LTEALTKINAVVLDINEKTRNTENAIKILGIQNKISGGKHLNLIEPTRRFIHEGMLYKDSESNSRYFFSLQ